MSSIGYALWLMPEASLKAKLRRVIEQLGREFDAPVFDPHVTLYAGASTTTEFLAAAAKIAQTAKAVDLRMRRLGQSSLLTKTFFLQFDESLTLSQMTQTLKAELRHPSDYTLNPHLSLLYRDVPTHVREQLLTRRELVPEGNYRFDQLRVIELEEPVRPTTIADWKIIFESDLSN